MPTPSSSIIGNPDQETLTVTLDAALLAQVLQFTEDCDRAIEEGLHLWCQQQQQRRLHQLAQVHQQRHDDDETGWLV
jgi:hypothetical protein